MLYFLLFIFGLLVGSFLNVVIWRLEHRKKGILGGRSECPKCHKILKWYELIPLVSFFIQGRKCRKCHKPISWQYPLVELFTGLIFGAIFWQFGLTWPSIVLYPLVSVLMVLFVFDLQTLTIPDIVAYIGIILAMIYAGFSHQTVFYYPILAAAIAGGFFALLVKISHEKWMGAGDIMIGIIIGFLLSYPQILVGLFLAFAFGAIVGLALILLHRKKLKSAIAFGPFLIFAAIFTLFFGDVLLKWYLGNLF